MVRKPSSGADRRDVAHGAVVGRREQEADAGLVQRPPLLVGGRRAMLTPSAVSTSAMPDCDDERAVAVLGDLQAAAGRHEADGGGDVEGVQAVAAGAADVDDVVGRARSMHGRARAWPGRRR